MTWDCCRNGFGLEISSIGLQAAAAVVGTNDYFLLIHLSSWQINSSAGLDSS